MKYVFLAVFVYWLSACSKPKIKVIAETYQNGKTKTIRYFSSKKDSREKFSMSHENGIGTADKPLSFIEEGYYENGNLEYRGNFIKGQTSGLWKYYYETNIPEAKCYYDKGKVTDTVYCWFPSGKLKRLIVEIDPIKNYWHNVDYYENGAIKIDSYQTKDSLDNFVLNGLFQEWYDNGKFKIIATFKDGWTFGSWKNYKKDGTLIEESDKPLHVTIE